MTTEEIELQIRAAVTAESHSMDWYGMPGSGVLHPCAVRALIKYIQPLQLEIERLKEAAGLKLVTQ